jgi:CheY-like chemotaxis protein
MSEHSIKILIVEDEAVVLHTLDLILKQHGYSTRGVRSGTESISIAQTFCPDILLCDINLPDIDGIQVALTVKKTLPDVQVLLLSGEISSAELLDEANRQGHYFEVLAKPAEPRHLLRVLESKAGMRRDASGIHRVK